MHFQTSNVPTDKQQKYTDQMLQRSPAKLIPQRSERKRQKFKPYEHIP